MLRKRFFGFTLSIQLLLNSYMVGVEWLRFGKGWWWLNFSLGPVYISLEPTRTYE